MLLIGGCPLDVVESRLEDMGRGADLFPGRVSVLRAFIAALLVDVANGQDLDVLPLLSLVHLLSTGPVEFPGVYTRIVEHLASRFLERGGMVNLVMVKERVRFEVNLQAAEEAGLKSVPEEPAEEKSAGQENGNFQSLFEILEGYRKIETRNGNDKVFEQSAVIYGFGAAVFGLRDEWPWPTDPPPAPRLEQLFSQTVDTLRRGETVSQLFARQGIRRGAPAGPRPRAVRAAPE